MVKAPKGQQRQTIGSRLDEMARALEVEEQAAEAGVVATEQPRAGSLVTVLSQVCWSKGLDTYTSVLLAWHVVRRGLLRRDGCGG